MHRLIRKHETGALLCMIWYQIVFNVNYEATLLPIKKQNQITLGTYHIESNNKK